MAEAVDRRDPGGIELSCELEATRVDELLRGCGRGAPAARLGVGDDEQRVDVEPALADGLDEPLDEHRRLPRSRSGRDEDDARRLDRRDLLGIRSVHWRLTGTSERGRTTMGIRHRRGIVPHVTRLDPLDEATRACSVARSICAQNSSSSR